MKSRELPCSKATQLGWLFGADRIGLCGYREYLPRPSDRVHPYACPLASTRLKGLPSTLMVLIAGDPLQDEADAYVAKLAAAGVQVERTRWPGRPTCVGVADATRDVARRPATRPSSRWRSFIASISRRRLARSRPFTTHRLLSTAGAPT